MEHARVARDVLVVEPNHRRRGRDRVEPVREYFRLRAAARGGVQWDRAVFTFENWDVEQGARGALRDVELEKGERGVDTGDAAVGGQTHDRDVSLHDALHAVHRLFDVLSLSALSNL